MWSDDWTNGYRFPIATCDVVESDRFIYPNPFGGEELSFEYEKCPKEANEEVLRQWAEHVTRVFVCTELRPRIIRWLANFPKYSIRILSQQQNVPKKLQQVILDLYAKMGAPNMYYDFGPCLFDEASLVSIGPQCAPFFAAYFAAFRCTPSNEMKLDQPVEFGAVLAKIKSRKDDMLPIYRSVLNECLCLSHFGFPALFYSALMSAFISVVKAYYKHFISCTDGLTMDQVESIHCVARAWLESLPKTKEFDPSEVADSVLQTLQCCIIDLLIEKIYDLTVIKFPKSYGTLCNLRHCLLHTMDYGRDKLLSKLIDDVTKRLLNVAEDTAVMLDGYACCVDSLRELDPSCAIMHRVCGVIKEYLKKRPDTVRKIIFYITSEKRDQLAQHLGSRTGTIVDEDEFAGTNDEFLPEAMDATNWDTWLPDPPDALPGQSRHVRQAADVFNMLISIYGSKEFFVKEYRKLLAERLIYTADRDPAFESRYLQILKQRFNDGELHQCEVMLRDVEDSLRIDAFAKSKPCVPMNTCVMSYAFWNGAADLTDTVESLPPVLNEGLSCYQDTYEEHKENRTIDWIKSCGWVEMELELGGVTVVRQVTNANASVLYLFLEKESWKVEEVCEKLNVDSHTAKRRLEYWANLKLLLTELPPGEVDEVYRLAQSASGMETAPLDEEEDEDQAAMDDINEGVNGLEEFWTYTRNFLVQQGPMKAERLLKVYKYFESSSFKVNLTLEMVQTYLMRKVKQNLLSCHGGVFDVVRENT